MIEPSRLLPRSLLHMLALKATPLFRAPAARVLGFKASYRRHSSKKPRHASALPPPPAPRLALEWATLLLLPSAPLPRIYGLSLDRAHNPEIRPRITVEIVRGGGERGADEANRTRV